MNAGIVLHGGGCSNSNNDIPDFSIELYRVHIVFLVASIDTGAVAGILICRQDTLPNVALGCNECGPGIGIANDLGTERLFDRRRYQIIAWREVYNRVLGGGAIALLTATSSIVYGGLHCFGVIL